MRSWLWKITSNMTSLPNDSHTFVTSKPFPATTWSCTQSYDTVKISKIESRWCLLLLTWPHPLIFSVTYVTRTKIENCQQKIQIRVYKRFLRTNQPFMKILKKFFMANFVQKYKITDTHSVLFRHLDSFEIVIHLFTLWPDYFKTHFLILLPLFIKFLETK